ncbi:LysR family transcriptional regulator [Actinoallomurus purpureus]|uniref:LysR family transcriptional regulator n=1 Tax=Actinoallomurus purpureus TaxID=478114 RepID=UPI00209272EC|nr:LysR family transcriptional regulator [Actinoallomurus purpureus]MCO6010296.1 LysR family transcriptional regulator [Actinoallomurus purpureus]
MVRQFRVISSRQLEYVRAVARELHFTRAAEALRIAQPALSQQIRKLERQLGVALFERNNHRVRLTPAGAALLDHAERILSDLAAVEEEMLGWATGARGRIHLGSAHGLTVRLARLLTAFGDAYPAVEVELREMTSAEQIDDLHAGRLDAATAALSSRVDDVRLASHPLGEEPLVLITASTGPLAGERRMPVAALDGLDLIAYPSGSVVWETILSALAAAGARPRLRMETRDYTTARALAGLGAASAIVPRSIAEEPGRPVHVVRLEPEPVWGPVLVWSAIRRPGPALAAFLDFATRSSELTVGG